MPSRLTNMECDTCGQINWKIGDFGIDKDGMYATAICRNAHTRRTAVKKVYISVDALTGFSTLRRGNEPAR